MKRLIIIVLCATMVSSAVSGYSRTITKNFHKTVSFVNGGDINIRSVNGRIDVTSWNREEVDIQAEIRVKAGSTQKAERFMERVKINIDRMGNRLRIEGEYPRRNAGFIDWIFGDNINVSIHYSVKVPRQTNLTARSVNGKVSAENITGTMTLQTTNGSIYGSELNGTANAHTVNGSIKIELQELTTNERMNLETTNGSIKLTLPSDAHADIRASTVNGSIHTDFPLTIQGKISRKRIQGKINGGGAEIKLSTVNGSISLYEH